MLVLLFINYVNLSKGYNFFQYEFFRFENGGINIVFILSWGKD